MRPELRPDLRDVEAYGAPQLEAPVRLNTNECPYPLSEGFARDLADAVARIPFHRYPDREAAALRKALAEHAGHPPAGVWAANGSNEVIQHLCLAYGGAGRRALVFEPTYGLHSLIPRMLGMEVISERLGAGFRLGAEAVEACRRHRPAVTFVCSPNNPTGNAQTTEAVEALCEAAAGGLVIVDEAYGEFGGRTATPLVERHANLAVVRTFSKAFALAAARLGYCLADPELVDHLSKVRLPYHLSALTQAAGEVAIRYRGEADAILDRIRAERDRLVSGLGSTPGVEVFPSDANFVLFRTPVPAARLWQAVLDRGVLIRDVSAAPALERCLRVTAGTPEETGAFLDALPAALEDAS
ncbi:MAG TPA: histidinol-phosphate transaminase [Actinomycetota bacterium]|nr:histidinol-phosphate transaminase [Actinomycetota bacterium]